MRLLAVIGLAVVIGVFFNMDDRYRYPCQNPRNWETPQCKPPICSVEGTCPDRLLPPEMLIKEESK